MIGGFGGCSVDRISYISHWPEPDQTAYIRDSLTIPGGMTLNALLASSRLGAVSAYLGAWGCDRDGEYIQEYLRKKGVQRDRCICLPGGETPSSLIMADPAGRRTIFHKRGIRDRKDIKELSPQLEGITYLLLDGSWMEKTLEWAEEAAAQSIPIVLDLSQNNKHPLRQKLLDLSDYIILSEGAAQGLTSLSDPKEQVRKLVKDYGSTAVVTSGAKGSWCATGKECFHTETFEVNPIDTTGAGDTFHGAFAAALYYKKGVKEALLWASGAAALKCTQPGHQGLPDRRTLLDLIRTKQNSSP